MLTLVCGFMAYAKSVLESSPEIKYVPGLHSNQSSIEGLFSNIRSMSKDRTDLYASGILQQNVFKLYNKLKQERGNISYLSDMNNNAVLDYNPDIYKSEIERIGGMTLHDLN